MDTDFGRELIYKMSLALNLSICKSRAKIHKIQKLRPFLEISANRVRKQAAYEEFWMSDFELGHMNGVEKEEPINDLIMKGIGFNPAPSVSNPLVL